MLLLLNRIDSKDSTLTVKAKNILEKVRGTSVYRYRYMMSTYIASDPSRQERPYSNENTASRLLSEVKHCLVQLVLRWGTTLESWMLFFCFSYLHNKNRRITSFLLLQTLFTTSSWLPRRNLTRSSLAFLIVG